MPESKDTHQHISKLFQLPAISYRGIPLEYFAYWPLSGSKKLEIIQDLLQAYPKEMHIGYLENIRTALQSGKKYFADPFQHPQIEGIERVGTPITLETLHERFDCPIQWINAKIAEIEDWENFDDRIRGRLSKQEIRNYFSQLTDFPDGKGTRKQVLSTDQIDHLLRANFAGFSPRVEPKVFDTPNLSQTELNQFVYQFYKKHKEKNRTEIYAHFLKNNFSIFEDATVSTIKSNFAR